jgi:hypothetical protein
MVEEQIVKGNLRWLANFEEIHRDYKIGDVAFPIYSSGGLQEKGFFLSKIYSALVTPKYKIHFLLYTSSELDPKLLRKLVLTCKSKFGTDDWVFLSLVQTRPFEKTLKDTITSMADRTIGVAAFSLASKEKVTSNNVLGKGLEKQLSLTEPKFEAFDWPNYLKSFTIVFFLGTSLLVGLALSGVKQSIQPLTLMIMAVLSLIVGHRIYKTRYYTAISINDKGFQLKEGSKITERKWSSYRNVTIYISPKRETYLRLHAREETFDLPLSRTGLPRTETYTAIKQLISKE